MLTLIVLIAFGSGIGSLFLLIKLIVKQDEDWKEKLREALGTICLGLLSFVSAQISFIHPYAADDYHLSFGKYPSFIKIKFSLNERYDGIWFTGDYIIPDDIINNNSDEIKINYDKYILGFIRVETNERNLQKINFEPISPIETTTAITIETTTTEPTNIIYKPCYLTENGAFVIDTNIINKPYSEIEKIFETSFQLEEGYFNNTFVTKIVYDEMDIKLTFQYDKLIEIRQTTPISERDELFTHSILDTISEIYNSTPHYSDSYSDSLPVTNLDNAHYYISERTIDMGKQIVGYDQTYSSYNAVFSKDD